MFDIEQIKTIALQSKAEQWPYAKTFSALKAAGVKRYEANVSTHTITHYGAAGEQWTEQSIPTVSLVALEFHLRALQQALARVQQGLVSYEQFLEELGQAGVHHYEVKMSRRTITYSGFFGEEYTEKIPPFEEKEKPV